MTALVQSVAVSQHVWRAWMVVVAVNLLVLVVLLGLESSVIECVDSGICPALDFASCSRDSFGF